jgi:hypothetical protein
MGNLNYVSTRLDENPPTHDSAPVLITHTLDQFEREIPESKIKKMMKNILFYPPPVRRRNERLLHLKIAASRSI